MPNKQRPRRTKPRKPLPLIASIGEDRIAQLSNDLSEGIASGSTKEWRAVALHFRHKLDALHEQVTMMRGSVSALCLAENIRTNAIQELGQWIRNTDKTQR